MFPSNWFIRPHFRNLFKMVFKSKAVKLTHFEKSPKNTFLVNAKKWKKWEKWSSKWNHQKVALTNCHYFVNSDPHEKIEEVLTRRFVERESFQQKGTCIIFIVLLHGRGPYPSLIAFFATRDHLAPSRSRDLFLFLVVSETKTERGHASKSWPQANTWTSTHSHSQCALRAQLPMLNQLCQVKMF